MTFMITVGSLLVLGSAYVIVKDPAPQTFVVGLSVATVAIFITWRFVQGRLK